MKWPKLRDHFIGMTITINGTLYRVQGDKDRTLVREESQDKGFVESRKIIREGERK